MGEQTYLLKDHGTSKIVVPNLEDSADLRQTLEPSWITYKPPTLPPSALKKCIW